MLLKCISLRCAQNNLSKPDVPYSAGTGYRVHSLCSNSSAVKHYVYRYIRLLSLHRLTNEVVEGLPVTCSPRGNSRGFNDRRAASAG